MKRDAIFTLYKPRCIIGVCCPISAIKKSLFSASVTRKGRWPNRCSSHFPHYPLPPHTPSGEITAQTRTSTATCAMRCDEDAMPQRCGQCVARASLTIFDVLLRLCLLRRDAKVAGSVDRACCGNEPAASQNWANETLSTADLLFVRFGFISFAHLMGANGHRTHIVCTSGLGEGLFLYCAK